MRIIETSKGSTKVLSVNNLSKIFKSIFTTEWFEKLDYGQVRMSYGKEGSKSKFSGKAPIGYEIHHIYYGQNRYDECFVILSANQHKGVCQKGASAFREKFKDNKTLSHIIQQCQYNINYGYTTQDGKNVTYYKRTKTSGKNFNNLIKAVCSVVGINFKSVNISDVADAYDFLRDAIDDNGNLNTYASSKYNNQSSNGALQNELLKYFKNNPKEVSSILEEIYSIQLEAIENTIGESRYPYVQNTSDDTIIADCNYAFDYILIPIMGGIYFKYTEDGHRLCDKSGNFISVTPKEKSQLLKSLNDYIDNFNNEFLPEKFV